MLAACLLKQPWCIEHEIWLAVIRRRHLGFSSVTTGIIVILILDNHDLLLLVPSVIRHLRGLNFILELIGIGFVALFRIKVAATSFRFSRLLIARIWPHNRKFRAVIIGDGLTTSVTGLLELLLGTFAWIRHLKVLADKVFQDTVVAAILWAVLDLALIELDFMLCTCTIGFSLIRWLEYRHLIWLGLDGALVVLSDKTNTLGPGQLLSAIVLAILNLHHLMNLILVLICCKAVVIDINAQEFSLSVSVDHELDCRDLLRLLKLCTFEIRLWRTCLLTTITRTHKLVRHMSRGNLSAGNGCTRATATLETRLLWLFELLELLFHSNRVRIRLMVGRCLSLLLGQNTDLFALNLDTLMLSARSDTLSRLRLIRCNPFSPAVQIPFRRILAWHQLRSLLGFDSVDVFAAGIGRLSILIVSLCLTVWRQNEVYRWHANLGRFGSVCLRLIRTTAVITCLSTPVSSRFKPFLLGCQHSIVQILWLRSIFVLDNASFDLLRGIDCFHTGSLTVLSLWSTLLVNVSNRLTAHLLFYFGEVCDRWLRILVLHSKLCRVSGCRRWQNLALLGDVLLILVACLVLRLSTGLTARPCLRKLREIKLHNVFD